MNGQSNNFVIIMLYVINTYLNKIFIYIQFNRLLITGQGFLGWFQPLIKLTIEQLNN